MKLTFIIGAVVSAAIAVIEARTSGSAILMFLEGVAFGMCILGLILDSVDWDTDDTQA